MKDYSVGRLYVAEALSGPLTGKIKVGFTSGSVDARIRQLEFPSRLLHATEPMPDVRRIEHGAHRILVLSGGHVWGEWFATTTTAAVDAIELAVRQHQGVELALGGKFVHNRRKRGCGWGVTLSFGVSRSVLDELNAMRAERKDGADASQIVRELLVKALEAEGRL